MIRVGINGFGRIGKGLLRVITEKGDENVSVVAIKDYNAHSYSDEDFVKNMAYLLRDDSIYGKFPGEVSVDGTSLTINGKRIPVFLEKNIDEVDWGRYETNVVVEASGALQNIEAVHSCLKPPVGKVLVTRGIENADFTWVFGVNEDQYDPERHHILSTSTCTGNGFAPLAKAINDRYEIVNGFVATVHPVLSDEKMLDGTHKIFPLGKSFRNIKAVDTAVIRSAVSVVPELKGKLMEDSISYRIPTDIVSVIYAVLQVKAEVREEDVESYLNECVQGRLKGLFDLSYGYFGQPFVSSEFLKSTYSGVIDMRWLSARDHLIRMHVWHDNEYGYCQRVYDTLLQCLPKP